MHIQEPATFNLVKCFHPQKSTFQGRVRRGGLSRRFSILMDSFPLPFISPNRKGGTYGKGWWTDCAAENNHGGEANALLFLAFLLCSVSGKKASLTVSSQWIFDCWGTFLAPAGYKSPPVTTAVMRYCFRYSLCPRKESCLWLCWQVGVGCFHFSFHFASFYFFFFSLLRRVLGA